MTEGEIEFTKKAAIAACEDLIESSVYGPEVARVLKNTLDNLKSNNLIKFEVLGFEKIEKTATSGGNSGRVYVPPDWIGHRVALIRLD